MAAGIRRGKGRKKTSPAQGSNTAGRGYAEGFASIESKHFRDVGVDQRRAAEPSIVLGSREMQVTIG